jgi:histidinol-phosphatase (PHP family)
MEAGEGMTAVLSSAYDYHTHPGFSVDAEGSVEEYCQAAMAAGLSGLCFTTHFDLHPEREQSDGWVVVDGERVRADDVSRWLPRYLDEVDRAREACRGRLEVRVGLEVDFLPSLAERLERILTTGDGKRLDFVLGAVHCLEGLPFSLASGVEGRALCAAIGERAVLERYFALVEGAVRSRLFSCLAHVDLYRKCVAVGNPGWGDLARELAAPALARLAELGGGLEVNTRPVRAGRNDTFPGGDLLRLAAASGVTVLTTGSDAHDPATIGSGLDAARRAAWNAGFRAVHSFDRRHPVAHSLEDP